MVPSTCGGTCSKGFYERRGDAIWLNNHQLPLLSPSSRSWWFWIWNYTSKVLISPWNFSKLTELVRMVGGGFPTPFGPLLLGVGLSLCPICCALSVHLALRLSSGDQRSYVLGAPPRPFPTSWASPASLQSRSSLFPRSSSSSAFAAPEIRPHRGLLAQQMRPLTRPQTVTGRSSQYPPSTTGWNGTELYPHTTLDYRTHQTQA
jgi:hypothetical protein